MRMTTRTPALVAAMAFAAACVLAPMAAFAATITLQGIVNYVYDEDYNPVGGTLTTGEGQTYNIVWDGKGQSMVDDVYEEDAEVTGEVSRQSGKQWLKVASYKRVTVLEEMDYQPEEIPSESWQYDDDAIISDDMEEPSVGDGLDD